MPEGHSIHRYASQHRELLQGRQVAASSPQGRFSGGAARIGGRKLVDIDTHGKHLFYHWQRAETLHIHLGLYGKFRTFRSDPPPPTPATRLVLSTNQVSIYLAGPSVCELIDPAGEDRVLARLGPDPLKADTDNNNAAAFIANLSRRRIPIGAAILDQRVIAGLGNIYRAESLFLTALNPATPANKVPAAKAQELWATSVELLERGVAEGRIVTVQRLPIHPLRLDKHQQLYVYQRDRFPCRICGGPISTGRLADRSIWWCPSCQPL